MKLSGRRLLLSLLLILSLMVPLLAQKNEEKDLLERIRKEGTSNSQILKTMHNFADIYGPRLTGSPNHKRAAEWAVQQMTAWGLSNAHLKQWDFGHVGWLNERLTAHILSPVKDSLVCEVFSWTPGTRGIVRAKAYQLVLPERPSQEQLTAFFEKGKGESARAHRAGGQAHDRAG